jgi:predicted DNA-binding antitoxin AbrB/MazE fold protein
MGDGKVRELSGGFSMPPIEVIYENGVFRPLHPLDLPEGTRLKVTMIRIASTPPASLPPEQEVQQQGQVDEAAYEALLQQLDSIAALPLQSPAQPNSARDHDAILYPKQGKMP